jgi:hypothetical protein
MMSRADFTLLEICTPGVLDGGIVQARVIFESFLRRRRMGSFARIVARNQS